MSFHQTNSDTTRAFARFRCSTMITTTTTTTRTDKIKFHRYVTNRTTGVEICRLAALITRNIIKIPLKFNDINNSLRRARREREREIKNGDVFHGRRYRSKRHHRVITRYDRYRASAIKKFAPGKASKGKKKNQESRLYLREVSLDSCYSQNIYIRTYTRCGAPIVDTRPLTMHIHTCNVTPRGRRLKHPHTRVSPCKSVPAVPRDVPPTRTCYYWRNIPCIHACSRCITRTRARVCLNS